ncbi:MAG: hypothetical protein O2800_01925 [Planctomycetota bacterium]|nr:hypothetical protein [Planctomycetota bacterium]
MNTSENVYNARWKGTLGTLVCRMLVPLWVLTGALFKLSERDPRLLPQPIFDLVRATDGIVGLSGLDWLDTALRFFVSIEFILVAVMIFVPSLARRAAVFILGIFVITLLVLIVPLWFNEGFDKVLKGSCGCFGSSGPNPLVVLLCDAALLTLTVCFKPRVTFNAAGMRRGALFAATAGGLGTAFAFLVPMRGEIVLPQDPTPANGGSAPLIKPVEVVEVITPGLKSWPTPPATFQSFYLPEFEQWIGKRLDEQPEAALIVPAPPSDINTGIWNVLFYREDCDHCHELMANYMSGALRHSTMCIAIPDTDPALNLEMPCKECALRVMIKGPTYVLTTPVLLRIENGVVTRICLDPEDPTQVEGCIE